MKYIRMKDAMVKDNRNRSTFGINYSTSVLITTTNI